MKKYFIAGGLIVFSVLTAWCQLNLDVYAGISPGNQINSLSILVNRESPNDEFQLDLVQSKSQVFAGIKGNIWLKNNFFSETGLIYTRSEQLFRTEHTMINRSEEVEPNLLQTRHQLLLPLNIGVDLGVVEITSGLRLATVLSETNAFSHMKGFANDSDGLSLGWQTGVRCEIGGVLTGIEYLAGMEREGQGLSVNSSSLELNYIPGNFVFSLQYRM